MGDPAVRARSLSPLNMRRGAVLAAAIALTACAGSDGRAVPQPIRPSTASTTVPTTTPPPSASAATTVPEPTTSASQPVVRVALVARPGEVPPGRTAPIESSAWRAVGANWTPGPVAMTIRRGERLVLGVATVVDADGAFDQTFVMPNDAPAGSYDLVASQRGSSARTGFTIEAPPAGLPAEELLETAGARQLWAQRQAPGLLCSVLRVGGRSLGQVCSQASEQDFNGDGTLRFSLVADGAGVIVGVTAPEVALVRVISRDGGSVERPTTPASFSAEARFVMLVSTAPIRVISALAADGRILTTFTLNP